MNLHNLVRGAVGSINPQITAQYQRSVGYTTGPDFAQVPAYAVPVSVSVQRQALTYADLKMLDGLNLNGEAIALYVNGDIAGVRRPDGRGGDLFTMPDGSTWLVTHVLENWSATSGWTKVCCVRQMP